MVKCFKRSLCLERRATMYLGRGADRSKSHGHRGSLLRQCDRPGPALGSQWTHFLKATKQRCCLFLWTTFFLKLAFAGHVRGVPAGNSLDTMCFAKVQKSYWPEVHSLLEDLTKMLLLALSSSGLSGCLGWRGRWSCCWWL